MSSGVGLNDTCVPTYHELKLKKSIKFIIYRMSDDSKEIQVDSTSTEADFDAFLANLPETDCRWAVYDFAYESPDGKRNKLVFLTWSPDTAKIKSKMLYASSKEALRRKLDGIAVEIQATEHSEAAYETFLEKASRGK